MYIANKTKIVVMVVIAVLSFVLLNISGCTGKRSEPANNPQSGAASVPAAAPEQSKDGAELRLDRDDKGYNGVVSAARPEASQVGIDILKRGGNAIDAAVATGFALGVLEPYASGLGGGGFMLIRFARTGEVIMLDFRETAPGKAAPDMYKLDKNGNPMGKENTVGIKAVAVPGEVAGLLTALEKYGTMKREEVLKPAIEWAEKGAPVTPVFAETVNEQYDKIEPFEQTRAIFLKGGLPYEPGDKIIMSDLARSLRLIAQQGKDAFYKGAIARAIVAEMERQGGLITMKDLANYKVIMRKPVTGTYRGYEIISAPPVSTGGTHLIQLLNIVENADLKHMGFNTVDSWHVWAEAMKMVFADRTKHMGDPDYGKVPLRGLLSKEYARQQFNRIDMAKATANVTEGDPWKYESGSTTHYSVMDKEGNMVAVTKTLNHFFGSGVVVPGTGILLNNEMADFTAGKGATNNIGPGKRPLSSMTPTLVLKDGKPFLTVGSPGADRIIAAVALVISNVIDHGMDIQEAINAPRLFTLQSGSLFIENRISGEVREGLRSRGQKISVKKDYDLYFGGVQGVIRNEQGELHGGADPRRDGQAVAY